MTVLGLLTLGAALFSASSSRGPAGRPVAPASGAVGAAPAPPRFWVPVAFGPVQVAVPPSWFVVRSGAAVCRTPSPAGVLLLDWDAPARWCPSDTGPPSVAATVVTLSPLSAPVPTPASSGTFSSVVTVRVPTLGVEFSARGPAGLAVLHTLGRSPRAHVLAPGPGPAVPAAWKRVRFAGLSVAVPRRWAVDRRHDAPPCGDHVVLNPGTGPAVVLTAHAPLALPCVAPSFTAVAPVDGVEIDNWPDSYGGGPRCTPRRRVGLRLCLDRSSPDSILFVKVTEPGGRTLGVQIGLAGDGTLARTVLGSLRPS